MTGLLPHLLQLHFQRGADIGLIPVICRSVAGLVGFFFGQQEGEKIASATAWIVVSRPSF
jgi:hypothetical protein